jgi:hypothetical protein
MDTDMELWAKRLHAAMVAAKAGSVSGWFGQGKITKMISGDNLVAACLFLGVSPEFIMTGRGHGNGQSQSARLDAGKLSALIDTVDASVKGTLFERNSRVKARIITAAYMDAQASEAGIAAVDALIRGFLASMET